jgi:hypothetical protein
MERIVQRAGMYLSGLEIVPIHGNSYLWYITKKQKLMKEAYGLTKRIEMEEKGGLFDSKIYSIFSDSANSLREVIKNHVENHTNNNFKVAVYGAAAKGNTFINFCNIKIDNVYDDNDLKIGKHSPINNCIVENPRNLTNSTNKFLFIITAWNFVDEIIAKIKKLRPENDDSYLVYYPKVKVERIYG